MNRAESQNAELRHSLQPLYKRWTAQKYMVVQFVPGTEPLEDLTKDLLLYNRTRLRELEKAKEKAAAGC